MHGTERPCPSCLHEHAVRTTCLQCPECLSLKESDDFLEGLEDG